MGLFWGRKKKAADPSPATQQQEKQDQEDGGKRSGTTATTTTPEAQRPEGALLATETSVFEFGSAGGSEAEEPITLAGYCPVSDGLEPCRWEVLPSGGEAPKFRIIF